MKFFATLLASSFAVATVAAQSALVINTPARLVEGQSALLTWSGGVAPYELSVQAGNAPGTTLEDLGKQDGTSFTWQVDIAAGTSVAIEVADSAGNVAQSAAVTIQ
ncbi:hypothetical protein K435DRAFT_777455 [Dendrothele bispora CBS 962.96]|uniref:Uncharacterized protein n=1 Tax=Dendrothele bispora (strain CBS 962.96) TaxID=1314807 RepID=A0A4S8M8G1_DENBC|nr:hypothetical protein K435DRAFT_777455 [Dendrothele bispora CBS 962.96]